MMKHIKKAIDMHQIEFIDAIGQVEEFRTGRIFAAYVEGNGRSRLRVLNAGSESRHGKQESEKPPRYKELKLAHDRIATPMD